MTDIFRKEALENRKYSLTGSIVLIRPLPIKIFAIFILIFLLSAVLYLASNNYTKKITGKGVTAPVSGLIKIKMQDQHHGIVDEVLVEEGSKIDKGIPIATISNELYGDFGFEVNTSTIEKIQENIQLKKIALKNLAVRNQTNDRLIDNEIFQINTEISLLKEQLVNFSKRIKINSNIFLSLDGLVDSGNTSRFDKLRQNDLLLNLKNQKLMLNSSLKSLQISVIHKKETKALMHLDQIERESALRFELKSLLHELELAKQRKTYQIISPIDGTITGLQLKKGQLTSTIDLAMSIIPENTSLHAVLYIPSASIGFIEIGDYVNVRYDAFPIEKFGNFKGRVSSISKNVLLPTEHEEPIELFQPSYRVTISLEKSVVGTSKKQIPLVSGMKLTADIVIEERSLLEWILRQF